METEGDAGVFLKMGYTTLHMPAWQALSILQTVWSHQGLEGALRFRHSTWQWVYAGKRGREPR